MTTTSPTTRRDQIIHVVTERLGPLQQGFLADKPAPRATLARLRSTSASEVGIDPMLWALTVADLPATLAPPRGDDPSRAERAIHAAVVLYAVHQQGHRQPMHRAGISLGQAVGSLARDRARETDLDLATIRRLHRVVTTQEWSLRLHHLRGLIGYLRSSGRFPVDYAALAADLDVLAHPARDQSGVLTRWARDLHRRPPQAGDDPTTVITPTQEEVHA